MPLCSLGPRHALWLAVFLTQAACSTTSAQQPPTQAAPAPSATAAAPVEIAMPTPASVNPKNPGGDAPDPEGAALMRLLNEPWGARKDNWNTLHVGLVDWKNWRGVKVFGHPTRASFRYGDKYVAAATISYTTIEGPNEPEACLARFIDESLPLAEAAGVRVIGERQRVRLTQSVGADVKPMVVELIEGRLDTLIARDDYVGAIAAYQSFPGTCLVQGFAAVSTNHRDIAIRVRDRWVAEGATRLLWERHVKEAPETLSR